MILIIIGRAAQFILLLLVMRIATTYLPPEEMGRLSLLTATVAFYALILVNPVGMFINRRFHAWDALGRAKYYFKLHWIYLLMVSGIAAVSLTIFNQLHSFGFQFNIVWLLSLVCGSLLFNTINQTAIPSINMLEFRGRFIILTLATIGTGLIISFLLVMTFEPTAELWMLGLLIGQTLFALVGVKVFFEKLQPQNHTLRPSRAHLILLFSFAWPVAVSISFNWLQTQGYRFIMADHLGLASLGLFVAGYGISAGLMAAFETVLTTYFQPKFYKHVSGNNTAEQSLAWNKYAGAILPSLMLVTFLIIGLAPELTRFIMGPDFQAASQFVVWGVLAEGARVIAGIYSLSAHAKMKTKLLMFPNILGALLCIVLIWLLVSIFGAHGVGLARVLAALGMLVCMHYMMIVSLDMKLPYVSILKGIVMGGGLMLLIIVGRSALGDTNSLINSGILIIVAGLAFLPMFFWLLYPFLPRHDKF